MRRRPSRHKKICNFHTRTHVSLRQHKIFIYEPIRYLKRRKIKINKNHASGLIMRTSVCGSITEDEKFNDAVHWELEEEDDDDLHKVSKIKERNNQVSDQLPMGNI